MDGARETMNEGTPASPSVETGVYDRVWLRCTGADSYR
jgi:hypothetical protein